ncbi:GlxA family transcriptional regulator [Stackebrandtia nassauensis]|uniref:Transcriptional regulator, AraC family n=1 Tax=Stackebrandtia nassauensis (strain DSM 44728 / CIP 108903 / NRRL B-16338 / NBRC 102104 / LLR-40K-21) TaxID=446470 RepID=D3PXB7_STANL|nr:helix-turn-helix domain-containing protein [Stackebrandtia nassauensis]ADD41380.1 transcriptional regulator, AraC family [Stackebrandtia nassauensis DSM 44728]
MRTIAVLAFDTVVGFELAMPGQIFGSARSADGEALYRVRICAPSPDIQVNAAGGPSHRMLAPFGLDGLDGAGTVIVPAHETDDIPPVILDALRRKHSDGARVASICTGAEVLAAAGLLDDRPAATHWRHADRIARRFPRVRFDASVLYVDDGRVLTGAGVSAGIDLCLHLIRRDHGAAVAAEVARRIVMAPERGGGQAQFIPWDNDPGDDRQLADTMTWARARLHAPLTLDELAAHARVSVRTLIRRFREQTSQTPLQWLIGQRVQRARELLETTNLDMEDIARRCGFGVATALRHQFRRRLATTPTAYRQAFRSEHPA